MYLIIFQNRVCKFIENVILDFISLKVLSKNVGKVKCYDIRFLFLF